MNDKNFDPKQYLPELPTGYAWQITYGYKPGENKTELYLRYAKVFWRADGLTQTCRADLMYLGSMTLGSEPTPHGVRASAMSILETAAMKERRTAYQDQFLGIWHTMPAPEGCRVMPS